MAPFRHAAFAVIWTATLVSNVGGWMYSAASGWFMTSLNPDPFIVALVQVADTLPICLLALPAGALADGNFKPVRASISPRPCTGRHLLPQKISSRIADRYW